MEGQMRCVFFFITISLFLSVGLFAQEIAPEVKKDGWWVKIDNSNNPQEIILYVGSNSGSYGFWQAWGPGDPVQFDVSDEYRKSEKIYVRGQTTTGLSSRFCVMYQSRGVRHFDFDLEEDHEMKQSDESKECRQAD